MYIIFMMARAKGVEYQNCIEDSLLWYTDYERMMCKSIILYGPKSHPKPKYIPLK